MRYEVIAGGELTADLTQRWADVQEGAADLASPYFRPEFTGAVSSVRDDVRVGLLEDGGRVVGFFPFHRRRGGRGRPIGLGLSDFHGVIVESGAEWTAGDLLRGCRLTRYEFDHLLASQDQFAGSHLATALSPRIELTGDYGAYEATRDSAGRKQLRESERKRAKLAQRAGLRFAEDVTDAEALSTLIKWKAAQCARTGTVDYFARPWCAQLVRNIHASQSEGFGACVSCLYAGETLVAAHFLMRSSSVWHSWFPAYAQQFKSYSPGMILLMEVIRAAARQGVHAIDLGKGMSLYKRRVMTGSSRVAEGCVETSSVLNYASRLRTSVEQWSHASALRPVLRIPGRFIRRLGQERRDD